MRSKLLFCFLLLPWLLTAESHEELPGVSLAHTSGIPSSIVHGVNVMTGDYMEAHRDISIEDGAPLSLDRFYNSTNVGPDALKTGWRHNQQGIGTVYMEDSHDNNVGCRLGYREPSGNTTRYAAAYPRGNPEFTIELPLWMAKNPGLTNCYQEEIGARTNYKNYTFKVSKSKRSLKSVSAITSDGTKIACKFGITYEPKDPGLVVWEWEGIFLPTTEWRPNEQRVNYKYDTQNRITEVTTSDRSGQAINWLKFNYGPDTCPVISISSSDNRQAIYHFIHDVDPKGDKAYSHLRLSRVQLPNHPEHYYYYSPSGQRGVSLLSHVQRGDKDHFTLIDYYKKEDKVDKKTVQRVKQLQGPRGLINEAIVTYRFQYEFDKDGGKTAVFDALGRKTVYGYAKDRLKSISRYCGQHLHSTESFRWGFGDNECLLKSRMLCDENNEIFLIRNYRYDKKGNVLIDQLHGNLTGLGKSEYEKTYTYSDDEYNLMLSESDGAKKTLFSYVPNTNRVSATFVCENSDIKKRSFFTYDFHGFLYKKVEDDGATTDPNDLNGVTERHITYTIAKLDMPNRGLPEVVENKYLDLETGQERLLSKQVNSYSPYGKLIRQEHYDSDNCLAFTLLWDYDGFGNVIFEQDALGNTIHRAFDPQNNLLMQQGPRPDAIKKYAYDFCNRLIREEQIEGSSSLVTTYEYDIVGNRIATNDPYGQRTQYSYNDLNQIVSVQYPATFDQNGLLYHPTATYAYDLLGHVTMAVDPNGQRTETFSTIRGDPYKIRYPDGNSEQMTYTPSGLLQTHTKNGTTTTYTYDYQSRLLEEVVTDSSGQCVKRTANSYNAFHLVSSTDAAGYVTSYTYDGAGRPASKTKENRTTTYAYDTLGRKWKEVLGNSCFITYYDNKNRIIEEQTQNLDGVVLLSTQYRYDANGNRTHQIEGKSVTLTEYNSLNQPTSITDPLEHASHIDYNHQHINAYGQNVLQKTTTDPLGQRTVETYNTQNLVAITEKYSSYGELLAKEEFIYDPCHNLLRVCRTLLPDLLTQVTTWDYDSMGRTLLITEAAASPEQKQTRYSYNIYGQKETITKPDGVILYHTYDPLGLLSTIRSSDNTISYRYTYDSMQNPISVEDLLTHNTTSRKYNPHGDMIEESLANGLTLSYQFDAMGRVEAINLPDRSTVDYSYDAAFLRQVSYGDIKHTYEQYDQAGELLLSQTPVGEISYQRDPLHRPIEIIAPHFTETELSYDPVGNLTHFVDSKAVSCAFSYDGLYQLQTEKGVADHEYSHDSLYNRRKKDDTLHEINALNQLTTQGETHYSYDACGNLTHIDAEEPISCTYDAFDRLITYTKGDKTIHYTYDAFNRRLTKSHIRYIYADQKEIGSYHNEQLVDLRILGSGLGAEIGSSVALYLNKQWFIPIHDHNGSITTLLDTSGHVCESYRYTAFGEEEENRPSINPWHFASKRKDPDTGWIAFGRRDYDPTIGRWVTPDPQGFEDGPNLYAYVHNNPLTHIDLWGLDDLKTDNPYSNGRFPSFGSQTYNFLSTGFSFMWNNACDAWNSSYIQGSLQMMSGASLFAGGIYGTAFAPQIGIGLAIYGADLFFTGMRTVYSGSYCNTYTNQCLQKANLPPSIADGVEFVASFVGGEAIKTAIREATALANASKFMNKFSQGANEAGDFNIAKKIETSDRLYPDQTAGGAHSVFLLNKKTKNIKKYATFEKQTNPRNPNPWECKLRYDGPDGDEHYNKALEKWIYAPHVHDPKCEGGIRPPKPDELPKYN